MKKAIKEKEAFELEKEYDFSKGIRGRFYRPKKISTTIRLDDDILLFFKKFATAQKTGYQTLLNNALREYVKKISKKCA
jgi:uncharacterized protein (DUF4415 family)